MCTCSNGGGWVLVLELVMVVGWYLCKVSNSGWCVPAIDGIMVMGVYLW